MSEEIQGDWVICSEWSEETLRRLPGNRTTSCARCHEPVVIAREGQAFIAANPLTAQVTCFPCALADDPDAVPGSVPGALERALQAGVPVTREEMAGKTLREYGAEGMS